MRNVKVDLNLKKLIFLLLLIVFHCGCKKDTSFDYSSGLIGKWSWFITCPGTNTKACWRPDSIYPSFEIAFTSEFIYNVYHNDIISASSKYSTYKAIPEDPKDTTYFIKFDTGGTVNYSIKHDTLSLENTEGIVWITSRYKKIEQKY